MERGALLDALVDLAREAGVTVRRLEGAAVAEARSGACRIRGEPWLLLAPGDPLEERIAAAAEALAALGEAWREGRFLAPAVREAVEEAVRRAAPPSPHGSRGGGSAPSAPPR